MMKKVVILLLFSAFALNSFAQSEVTVAPEKNVLKVNTLSLLVGTGSIFYEREISDLVSAQMGVGYMGYTLGKTKFSGLILTPECKFYIRNNAIDGFYFAPYLRYNKFGYESKEGDNEGQYSSYGGGLAFGRQWIFKKGFVIDFFFGGHYTDGSIDIKSGGEPEDVTKIEGLKVRVGLALGFAF
ncbi:MAG: DUF3575 domain-containing protein [Bacteroidales bacterium]|jgi:hypothetical protein|nr:DUF3575 domain-containing protein [Bacteroidales bacterium]MBP7037657.1 DUF3575 domain-containing protein [Bacteroidales bacterium]MZP66687.1 DUF3575 domain-containing protein [Bacteroidales bacterium]NLK55259.1 DUF3575 domain-containing protein [Bacteroidales bacterium]HPB13984.1 DUF3575 domain-containing protein [Bacteroidales bacterium]